MKRISTAFFVVGLMLLCMATAAQAVGEIVTIAGGAVRDGGPATLANVLYPGGVAVDSKGNIYLSDTGHNRIRMISPAGIITTVAGNGKSGFSGDGGVATSAMLKNPMGVAVDSSGNLYIADQGNQRIRKVSAGKITTVAGTGRAGYTDDDPPIPATTAQLNSPYGLAVNSAGDLYIADQSNCCIRKISQGMITTVAGTPLTAGDSDGGGIAKAAQLSYPAGVAVDAAGYLYIADVSNSKIWKVSPDGKISLFAGNGTDSYGGDGGNATLAMLNWPTGVAVAPNGDVYIADRVNEVVRRVSKGIITTYAGLGKNGGSRGDGGPATEGQLKHPSALAVDGSGNLYITEHGNNQLRKVAAGTSILSIAAGGVAGEFYGDGGPAALASFSHPYGMAFKGGDLYVGDVENNRIRKINAVGVISTVAGNGAGGYDRDAVPATSAKLNSPHGVAFSPAGELYIADSGNHRVRKVNTNGVITTVAGSETSGYTGDGGPATAATLNFPSSVAVDSSGTLYIADQENHVIRRVKGGTISTFAGTGTEGTLANFVKQGPATAVPLATPWWVSVDSAGNVYIADLDNYCIRKVDTSGYLTTVAGTGPDTKGVFAGDDGPATSAKLYLPGGVVVDSKGEMYIADQYNYRVRKVDANGNITTVAGNGQWGYTGDGGPATAASLAYPTGLAVDANGNLYIGDRGNKVIRKLTVVTTVPGRPINVVAKPYSGRAVVTFAPPISNGGSPILGYTVISNPAGGIDNSADGRSLSHNITGLKNGVSYVFTVKARNAIGTGLPSIASNRIPVGTPPSPPVMGKATAGNAKATVTFTAPANNGGWPILGYTVISSPAGGVDLNAGSRGLSHVMTRLKNGTAYTFTVRAKNVVGFGTPSVKSNVVIPTTVPGPPLNVKAVKGNARATVTFSPPASNGGSAITGYTVTSVPAGGIDASAGKATLSHVITGLKNGVAYTFIVKAKNVLGFGPPSAKSNMVIPATVPGPPLSVKAVKGNARATVTFSPPASNGGSAITGYTVISVPAGGIDASAGKATLSHVVTGLKNGTGYTFIVKGKNAVGIGLPSLPSNKVVPSQ